MLTPEVAHIQELTVATFTSPAVLNFLTKHGYFGLITFAVVISRYRNKRLPYFRYIKFIQILSAIRPFQKCYCVSFWEILQCYTTFWNELCNGREFFHFFDKSAGVGIASFDQAGMGSVSRASIEFTW